MKFFADTANIQLIEEAVEYGLIDGVTTNPSLMAKEGISGKNQIFRHYKLICDLVHGDVSAEVIATDWEEMVREGEELAEIHPHIVVKVPITRNGLKALHILSRKGIRTNCTLIFSPGQALLAAKAGATYISPFIGRLDDISQDGLELIRNIREIFDNYNFDTQLLAASVRSPLHIVECARVGADVVTCPPASILALLNHPLTDIGLEKFLSDHARVQNNYVP